MKLLFSSDTTPTTGGLVVLCPSGDYVQLPGPLSEYDGSLGGHLSERVSRRRFSGKKGKLLSIDTLGKLPFSRLLLLGTGEADSARAFTRVGERAADLLRREQLDTAALLPLDKGSASTFVEPLARGLLQGAYRFDRYKSPEEDDPPKVEPRELTFVGMDKRDLSLAVRTAEAVAFARDLVNEPAAEMTPRALAEAAGTLTSDRVSLEVLDEVACHKLGMGLFLAVSRGAAEPPRLIHMTYRPEDPDPSLPKVALVGKGITFDSGGLSLKPSASMKDMKSDMAGAATVLASMSLLAAAGARAEVHGIAMAAENMPGGHAYRLGDIIRGMDGPSVEITNTDAEGRLALADGISYARSLGCELIMDLATLTGACLVALGPDVAGVMGTPDSLCGEVLRAARDAGELMWQLPLVESLRETLSSQVADCKNTGSRWGGAITAALFLSKFAGDTDWVHVDLAGPAFLEKTKPGRPAGGTGFGVATVVQWLARLEGSLEGQP